MTLDSRIIKDEMKYAFVVLDKFKKGKDEKKAELAKRILNDKALFAGYLQLRLEKKGLIEKIENKPKTFWERIKKFFA